MSVSARVRPFFVPVDFDWASYPPELRKAYEAIVEPAYDEFVVQAPTALERSAGASLVYLLFQELLEQVGAGQQLSRRDAPEISRDDRDAQLARTLRLIGAKERAGSFLMRVRNLRASGAFPLPIVAPIPPRE